MVWLYKETDDAPGAGSIPKVALPFNIDIVYNKATLGLLITASTSTRGPRDIQQILAVERLPKETVHKYTK